ncbi:MAG: MBL fold metallo-hydrolase [Oscillospiraceae bacterium]
MKNYDDELKNAERYKNANLLRNDHVNCYVIRCMGGDVLIDTGRKSARDEIETWLSSYYDIKLIFLTHGHIDAAENAKYFSELYHAPIAMSRYDYPLIHDNLCRTHYITSLRGRLHESKIHTAMDTPMDCFTPDYFVEDGMRLCDLDADGIYMDARIVSLDGHTRGSIGILNGGDLYCGDALTSLGSSFWSTTAESPKAAKYTMERIAALAPDRIFPCHGEDPLIMGEPRYEKFIKEFSLIK